MSIPYRIEIVPADRGWILETIAQAIAREAALRPERYKVSIVDEPTGNAELTFFVPESAFRPLKNSITVTYLAHKEDHKGAAALFEEVARESDYCITSSTKYQKILQEDGAKKVFKVHLGTDTGMFTPRLRLGVVGRTYNTGRKGEALLAEIAGLPMVELRFTGEGWPHPAGYYATTDLVEFYRDIDYLLMPSLIEGGPVPLLEALSAGCPVIAPTDIGLVEDFPHIPFKRGDAKDLRRVVEELLQKKLALRDSVLDCDWQIFAQHHLEIFAGLIDEKRQVTKGALDPVALPSKDHVRVLLVTHGMEDASKGGPSTRVRLIVSQLKADGHFVETRHNINSAAELDGYDIVHVFNSWPPQTAQQCMAIARNAGKTVIFSPITLDLADWPIYRQLIDCAFATGDRSIVESVVGQLPMLVKPRRYAGPGADPAVEGIPGHFEALRKCCALADHVIFLSELERDLLTAIGARTDHGALIHNGVSNIFMENASPDLFRKHAGVDKYVLCVGRIEYRKNQALLAMAMRDMDVPLILIGDVGDAGYLELARLLGGPNLYHYARIDDKALLASAYAGASVFVLPSWSEGAPLAALEAGLTGVPLILSDMSSEQEYFGDHASYISPADISSMRAAVVRALESNESAEARQARASFMRTRYSETEHVRNTLDLYRRASTAFRSANDPELIVDVSSLLHSLRVGSHLTGVPLAESHMVAELVRMRPDTRCIAYNDIKGRFIEILYADLKSFDHDRFNSRYWFSNTEPTADVDLRIELTLHNVFPPPLLTGPAPAAVAPVGGRLQLWSARTERVLGRIGFSQGAIARIKQLAKRVLAPLRTPRVPATPAAPNFNQGIPDRSIDFSNVSRYLVTRPIARSALDIKLGSRILTLGQSWLSNEPLLDKLIEISAGHQLEAYVYDISYISGAHFSGWTDNDDRQRRLVKLLRHCNTVFTESRVTASELAKFASSRSMGFRIVRTKLRGKEPERNRGSNLLGRQHPYILFVSSFNRRKNHDFIVSVWKDLIATNSPIAAMGVKLLLVGEIQGESKYGDPEYQENLRRINIEVVNNASDEQLSHYYSQCLFTVFPSLQEGWGIPVQESLMYGKVCLVSDTVPVAEEIDNAALVKLSPNDFFGWREAISTWATNQNMRAEFEKQAVLYIPPTWQEIAQCVFTRTETPTRSK